MSEGDLRIGDGVSLGANAVILGPGVVGHRVVLGAGSVLIGSAPAGATMIGAPARPKPVEEPSG
jgi:acetyltransferase-like isoleucine patch superfamily enzyme